MAFLSGWLYRKPVTLSRASGAVTNYQMKLKVGESAGSGTNDVLATGCKADFSDLRFTKADGTTLLDYWIESASGTTPNQVAMVWIEFDSIGTGATSFYMYYGNAGAAAASNGPNTFILFEDFNALADGDLNGQNGWTGNVRWDVAATTKYEGTKAIQTTGANTPNAVVKTISSGGAAYHTFIQMRMRYSAVAVADGLTIYLKEGTNLITGITMSSSQFRSLGRPSTWVNIGKAPLNNTWYKASLAIDAMSTHKIWVDDTEYFPAESANYTNVSSTINAIELSQWGIGGTAFVDQIIVGYYLPTGPAWGSWGAEEGTLNHYTLAMDPGSFSLTGTAILLPRSAISLGLSPGVFSMVGSPLSIWKVYPPMILEPGAFALTGTALSIKRPMSYMKMDPGAFAMNGTPMIPHYGWYKGVSTLNYQFQKQRRQF